MRHEVEPVGGHVLPAYAGMILRKCGSREKTTSAPRVCGDDPPIYTALMTQIGCSPRMRG